MKAVESANNDIEIALSPAVENLSTEKKLEYGQAFYNAISRLGEVLISVDPSDPDIQSVSGHVSTILKELAKNSPKQRLLAALAERSFKATSRANGGLCVVGTVKQIGPSGKLFAVDLELVTKNKTVVTVLAGDDSKSSFKVGTKVLLLGAMVADPALNLTGYDGNEAEARYVHVYVPIAAEAENPERAPVSPPVSAVPVRAGDVVGRYISDQQVLVRFDAKTGDWFRLRKESSLLAGDRILVFPSYRPQISLVSGVQITVSGESLIEFLQGDDKGVAHLKIDYGRVSIITSGKPGAQIRLNLGKQQGLVSFENIDSSLAVEVRNYRYPGNPPDKVSKVAELFATSGKIHWAETAGESTTLIRGQIRIYLDDKPGDTEPLSEMPEWVRGTGLKEIERSAAQTLSDVLVVDGSLILSLQEQTKETKVELRSLAIRSLMQLDVFEPFVHSLSDDRQKSFWFSQYDSAQLALARGPESAAQLRLALEGLSTANAPSLYRMLIGYSPDELNRGGAANLIEFLEHESLDLRVLAAETLLRITGKSLTYRPEVAQPRRLQAINRWKQELKAGAVVYKTIPSPF